MRKLLSILVLILGAAFCYGQDTNKPAARLGAGVGIPYGIIGINTEIYLGDYLSIMTGLGRSADEHNAAYCAGGRIYFQSRSKKTRLNIPLCFGTVGVLETWGLSTNLNGAAGGVGLSRNYSRLSFNVDILYVKVTTDTQNTVRKDNSDIKMSVGYGWHF